MAKGAQVGLIHQGDPAAIFDQHLRCLAADQLQQLPPRHGLIAGKRKFTIQAWQMLRLCQQGNDLGRLIKVGHAQTQVKV